MAVICVYLVGKIDIEIYNCITKDITTDEVIITDERIQHIKEHHPNNYEQYYSYMRSIIENPEYIIEANKPNTALILKSFSNGNETFKTVLRLITSSDNSKFKNSIITFMKINEKEWIESPLIGVSESPISGEEDYQLILNCKVQML